MTLAAPGTLQGHVPDGLIYGPVASRRFGRSLGISFSLPGAVGCRWSCPYCQLGGGSPTIDQSLMAQSEHILDGLEQALARNPGVDVVTIAGAGEPLDHPQAAELLRSCHALTQKHGLPLVLLTNGDGLLDNQAIHGAAQALERVYMKWDPGAASGSWRAMGPAEAEARFRVLGEWPGLRVQSLLFTLGGSGRGNIGLTGRDRYVQDMLRLQPQEIQLTAADRSDPRGRAQAVSRSCLQEWAGVLSQHLPETVINVF
ncbi:MAG: radical SAM protein [Planctomycetota bacterium]|nr:MAG: radical SAM protein [Planctomycetota bacterium]